MLKEPLRQILAHIAVKVKSPLLPELERAHPDEGLGDAAPLKASILVRGNIVGNIRISEIVRVQHLVAVKDANERRGIVIIAAVVLCGKLVQLLFCFRKRPARRERDRLLRMDCKQRTCGEHQPCTERCCTSSEKLLHAVPPL